MPPVLEAVNSKKRTKNYKIFTFFDNVDNFGEKSPIFRVFHQNHHISTAVFHIACEFVWKTALPQP